MIDIMRGDGIIREMAILGIAGMIFAGGCGDGKKGGNASAASARNEVVAGQRELALPSVPDSITLPEERVAYAARHFWDALDVTDHTQSLDTAFMEQTFANFIALLPYAADDVRKEAATVFADKCTADSSVYDLAVHITQHYLDDPNSPMRNEELYIPFLERFSTDPKLSEQKRERAVFRLEQAMKNRPGTRATDFRLATREGRTTTLLRELRDTTLVLFYDNACEHCKETIERLQDPAMGIRYPVMAVDVTEDRDGWDATKGGMPVGWEVCFATDPLDGESYYFPALPSIYLLSPDGRVIVKDGSF